MTSIETGPTWLERLNPRNWTLVWKLVIVGLAPALLALTLGALRIADQAGSAAELGRSSRLFDVRTEVAVAADALRSEEYQASLYVAGKRGGDAAPFQAAVAKTDSALATVRTGTAGADLDRAATTALGQVTSALDRLGNLRGRVSGDRAYALSQVRNTYNQLVGAVDVLDRVLLREVRVADTANLVDALTAVQGVNAQLSTQHMLVGDALVAQTLQPGDSAAIDAAAVQSTALYSTYQLALTPEQVQRYGTFFDGVANARRTQLAAAVLDAPQGQAFPVTAEDWDAAYSGTKQALDRSAEQLRQDVAAAGAAAQQQASNQAGINSVVLMLGLLIGIAIAVLVARSLIRSLRVLRTAALDVAERRLPDAVEGMRAGETPDVAVDPVPIATRDEVGQVARAFDAVHGQAVRLAADQAALQANVSAMFVNLSRRSQALVERQLQLIEQLESNEQDADQLSNLFQLDHLATRMRRNSENLLVLAGTDLAKRNVAPVPMVDVLRAAVSEVEQYQRVVVQAPPPVSVVGRAGSDLVHLLAELLDNATNFSPPDSQVVMATTRTPDGSIVVEIADRGVGMADHELSDANQRLSGPATVDVSASRRMGLFVVGRLATRHGIGVRLAGAAGNQSPGTGLTASVTVPSYLVPTGVPAETGRPIGVPQPAGVPAQGGASRTGGREARAGSSAAPALGIPAPASQEARSVPAEEAQRGGPAPVNGSINNGLPTRTPGSSLRPAGPGGPPPFGGDGPATGDSPFDAEDDDTFRGIAEQARLDQEAAARRDRWQQSEGPGAGGYTNGSHADEPESPEPRFRTDRQRRPDEVPPAPLTTPMPLVDASAPTDAEPRPADADGGATAPAGDLPRRLPRGGGPAAPRPTPGVPPVRRRPDDEEEPAAHDGTDVPGSGPDPRRAEPADFSDTGHVGPADLDTDRRPGANPTPASAGPAGPADGGPELEEPTRPSRAEYPPPLSGRRPSPFASRPEQEAEELFAPSVPALGADSGALLGADGGRGDANGFDMGETTPIFEEIASAWFRSNRPVPVTWPAPSDGEDIDGPAPESGTDPQAHVDAVPPPPVPLDRPAGPPPEADRPEPAGDRRVELPAAATPEPSFSTVADEGWRAASGIDAERPGELTAAGLPKRRPRARLVPGSAGSAVLAQPVAAARSAENIRGRLSSYQQGVRQGRESRMRAAAETSAPDSPPESESGEES